MRSIHFLVAGLTLFVATCGPTSAPPRSEIRVGPWQIVANDDVCWIVVEFNEYVFRSEVTSSPNPRRSVAGHVALRIDSSGESSLAQSAGEVAVTLTPHVFSTAVVDSQLFGVENGLVCYRWTQSGFAKCDGCAECDALHGDLATCAAVDSVKAVREYSPVDSPVKFSWRDSVIHVVFETAPYPRVVVSSDSLLREDVIMCLEKRQSHE